jgi:hypothetical protein
MVDYPFTLTLRISHYGWTVKVYEPTFDEMEALDKILNVPAGVIVDYQALQEIFVKWLQSWDCTDRQGNPLPCNLEGIKKLPPSVLFKMVVELSQTLKSGFSDPKANSESLPTTEPKPGETPAV